MILSASAMVCARRLIRWATRPCPFSYVVQDNTPPVLNFPPSQTLAATCCGADASYTVTATDSCDLVSLTCTSTGGASVPAVVSDVKFAVGVTSITCVAVNGRV